MGKAESLQRNGVWKIGHPHTKKKKLEPCLIPYTKIHSKWIKDLNETPKTLKLFEQNKGQSFMTLDLTLLSWI